MHFKRERRVRVTKEWRNIRRERSKSAEAEETRKTTTNDEKGESLTTYSRNEC